MRHAFLDLVYMAKSSLTKPFWALLVLSSTISSANAITPIWINIGFNDLDHSRVVNLNEIIKVEMGKDAFNKDLLRMWRSRASGSIDTNDVTAIKAIRDHITRAAAGEWLQVEPKNGYAWMRTSALEKVAFAYGGGCIATLQTLSGAAGASATIKDSNDCQALKRLLGGQPNKWFLVQNVANIGQTFLDLERVQSVRFKGPPASCSAVIELSTTNSLAVNDAILVKALLALLNNNCRIPAP